MKGRKTGVAAKLLKVLALILGAVLVLVCGVVIWLTAAEYRPADVEEIAVEKQGTSLSVGSSLTLFGFNTGYASLDKTQDFFMDGGKGVKPASADTVIANESAIAALMAANPADIYLLQEVDLDSDRSYNINQIDFYARQTGMNTAFARNYVCDFVPYPLPMLGRVESGLLTLTDLAADSACRISLPVPFSWPLRVANLKRCMLVEYFDISGSEAKLAVVNVHLEAYDDGDGKLAQTRALFEFAEAEYAKGNYVIIGGDFNQTFPGSDYELLDESYWQPGVIGSEDIPEGWQIACDPSTPTCRLLNEPYEGNTAPQYYGIDGFILSPNLALNWVQTVNAGFENSDHNPVIINISVG